MHNKQKKLIILFLLGVLFASVYIRRELFFQKAKRLVEENLGKSLQCELAIKSIHPSILSGLVVEGLEMYFPNSANASFSVNVDEARIDYTLEQFLFSGPDEAIVLRLISPKLTLAHFNNEGIALSLPSADAAEEVNTQRAARDLVFVLEGGSISFSGGEEVLTQLEGRVLLSKDGVFFQDIKAAFGENPANALLLYGELTQDELFVTAKLEHLKINNFDILSNATFTLSRRRELESLDEKISGTFKTYGSVFNNRPFAEISSSFEIKNSQLRIYSFAIGEEYDMRGIVQLIAPYHADLSLNFFQAAPHEFIAQLTYPQRPDFSGLVNGMIKMTGTLGDLEFKGYLESTQGHLGELDFVSADINIEGHYPKIYIVNSRINREEDSFIMDGEIDLVHPEEFELEFSADKGIFWKGWDITRDRDNTLRMSKNLADEVRITFDTFIDEQNLGFEDVYTNELGVEYKVFGDKVLKLRLKRDEGILGVERRYKF